MISRTTVFLFGHLPYFPPAAIPSEHYYSLTFLWFWISVAPWDALYDYDGERSFLWATAGDIALHLWFLLSSRLCISSFSSASIMYYYNRKCIQ